MLTNLAAWEINILVSLKGLAVYTWKCPWMIGKNVGGGFLAITEDVTSITAVFSLRLSFMLYIKLLLLGACCPEDSALSKARLKRCSYTILILGFFLSHWGK